MPKDLRNMEEQLLAAGTESAKLMVLWQTYRQGGPTGRVAYEKLVESLRKGVVTAVTRKLARRWKVYFDDLIGEGEDAMMKALGLFDDARGTKITTYVYPSVARAVLHEARRCKQRQRELAPAGKVEVLEARGLTSQKGLPTPADVGANEARMACCDVLTKALTRLTRRERQVLSLKHGLGVEKREMKDREIAERIGVSRSRVTQIIAQARLKLSSDPTLRRIADEW